MSEGVRVDLEDLEILLLHIFKIEGEQLQFKFLNAFVGNETALHLEKVLLLELVAVLDVNIGQRRNELVNAGHIDRGQVYQS